MAYRNCFTTAVIMIAIVIITQNSGMRSTRVAAAPVNSPDAVATNDMITDIKVRVRMTPIKEWKISPIKLLSFAKVTSTSHTVLGHRLPSLLTYQ